MGYLHGVETIEVTEGARPVSVVRSSVIGLIGTAPAADADDFPIGVPVLHVGGADALGDIGTTGTLPDALEAILAQGVGITAVIIRIAEGATPADTLAAIAGTAIAGTGCYAFFRAQALLGVSPRILLAPGWTSQRPDAGANPVVTAMLAFAQRRRGVIIADGPNTTKAAAAEYADDWGSDRVFVVDPGVTVFSGGQTVQRPASGYVAGLMARVDKEEGYWFSPSNHEIFGITGTGRAIDHFLGDEDTEANYLNENRVATIVRDRGWRLWGNETPASDTLNKFLAVRRSLDVVADSIQTSMLWAMDKPFSLQLILDIAETVNEFLRQLKARGAIIGGKVWLDPAKNTATTWAAGQLSVDYDAEAPAPMQRLTFTLNRNTGYYDELAAAAVAEIAQLTT